MRALVTGGCGFIGSNLVHALTGLGWTVDVVDDMSNGRLEFLDGLAFKVVPGFLLNQYREKYESSRDPGCVLVIESDFEDKLVLERVRNGSYDRVFHLAANPRVSQSVESPAATTDVNCTRTLSLLEAIRDCRSEVRFVFSSTCALYGDASSLPTREDSDVRPNSPYGLQKRFVEEYIRIAVSLHNIDAVCLRYFNVYGPRQVADSAYATAITAWCGRVKESKPLRSDGDGEQTRDLVYVTDVVRANILAAAREERFQGEVINIGSGKRYSNNMILSMFSKRIPGVEVVHAPPRPGDVRHTQANIDMAREVLGYVPQVQFEDGLNRTWDWWGI
jgi:UDP-glucose 4-epimerase